MAGPPIFFDQFGLGPHNAAFRATVSESPPPARGPGRRRLKAPRPAIVRQVLAWVVGVGGYAGLLLAAHGSRHADELHAVAIVWLIVFGALNAHLILEKR